MNEAFLQFLEADESREDFKERYKEDARDWFIIAKDDLEVSKILYDGSHFASSTYHLQQFYEKIAKCYAIASGRCGPSVVWGHKFSHDEIKKAMKDECLRKIPSILNEMERDSEKVQELVDNSESMSKIISRDEDIRKLNTNDYENIIGYLDSLNKKLTEFDFLSKVKEDMSSEKSKKGFKKYFKKLFGIKVALTVLNHIDEVKKEDIEKRVLEYLLFINLNTLALLTGVHETNSRYPYTNYPFDKKDLWFKDYGLDKGIIKVYPKLYEYGKIITTQMENLYFEDKP